MLSCVKEVPNTENPVCYKLTHVLKVIAKTDDGSFLLERVNNPFGILKMPYLQVEINAHCLLCFQIEQFYLHVAW